MQDELLDAAYEKFGSADDVDVGVMLPYILGEYHVKLHYMTGDTPKIEVLGNVLIFLAKDKLKMSIFVRVELEERVILLEEMAKKIPERVFGSKQSFFFIPPM